MKRKFYAVISLLISLGITLSAFSLNIFATTASTSEESNDYTYETSSRDVIPDGIYAFRNMGSTNRWMDVQRNLPTPGAHIQQYQFSSSPADNYAASGLFRVTQVGTTGRYIIRLMLNESLTFGFSGTEVLTKEISLIDSEVEIENTFYITYNNGGYIITPYGNGSYCICSNSSTASGASGAPSSYLIKNTLSAAGSKAKWIIEGYQTDIKDGIYALQNLGNQGRWMDIQQNLTSPGAHLQQYGFGESPAATYSLSGLFRITQIGHTGKYTIRLMLNENLSFGFSNSDVITKTISGDDSNVSDADTFRITYNNGGFVIRPYLDQEYAICAKSNMGSGAADAPESFLTKKRLANAGNRARWTLEGYQTFIDSGVYWLSNSVGISAGANPRIMDAESGGYTAGTIIQQWKSSSPEPNLYRAQTWIVTRLDNGYYTIASSQKPDMYITFSDDSTQKVVLKQCSDSAVENDWDIQWEIRGNKTTGYCIINRTYSPQCITVPQTTSNGTDLVTSDYTTSNNGRNIWTLNRINDVYVASIYCIGPASPSSGSGSSGGSFSDFGHAWIKFENRSTKIVKFGALDVPPNEYATVGKWGNAPKKQLWYNLERFNHSAMTTDNGGYISILIRPNQLQSASNSIIANHTDTWMPWDNCTHLANNIWEEITGTAFANYDGLPTVLLSVMKENTTYIDGTLVTYTDILGYGDEEGNFIQHDPDDIDPLQAIDQDALLTIESYEEYIEYMNVSKDDFTYDQYIDMIVNAQAEEITTSADTQSCTEPGKEDES